MWTDGRALARSSVHPALRRSANAPKCREVEQGRRMTQGRVLNMTPSRMRGLVLGVLLASCAALPATAQAATPTLTTNITCIDPTVDQNIDVIATGLAPNASDYPVFDLVEGADGDIEVGGPTVGNLDADASGTGTA